MNSNRLSVSIYFYSIGALVGLLLITIGVARLYALTQNADSAQRNEIERRTASSTTLAQDNRDKNTVGRQPLERRTVNSYLDDDRRVNLLPPLR